MKKLTIIFASLFIASIACAGEQHGGQHGKPGSYDRNTTQMTSVNQSARSESRAQSRAVSRSSSISTGGIATASGGAGGSAAGGTAVASVGAMNFTFAPSPSATGPSTAFVNHDYSGVPNNTPSLGNSYISTSNLCDSGSGAGIALPGFAGQFTISQLRMMCEGRLNAQAHNALGQTEKARLTMEVVQEFACEENATWAKIARKKGLCEPADEPKATASAPAIFISSQ